MKINFREIFLPQFAIFIIRVLSFTQKVKYLGLQNIESAREKSKNVPVIKAAVESTIGRLPFVTFDDEKLEGSFSRLPERDELPQEIDELLVVEYYKKLI